MSRKDSAGSRSPASRVPNHGTVKHPPARSAIPRAAAAISPGCRTTAGRMPTTGTNQPLNRFTQRWRDISAGTIAPPFLGVWPATMGAFPRPVSREDPDASHPAVPPENGPAPFVPQVVRRRGRRCGAGRCRSLLRRPPRRRPRQRRHPDLPGRRQDGVVGVRGQLRLALPAAHGGQGRTDRPRAAGQHRRRHHRHPADPRLRARAVHPPPHLQPRPAQDPHAPQAGHQAGRRGVGGDQLGGGLRRDRRRPSSGSSRTTATSRSTSTTAPAPSAARSPAAGRRSPRPSPA